MICRSTVSTESENGSPRGDARSKEIYKLEQLRKMRGSRSAGAENPGFTSVVKSAARLWDS